LFPLGGTIEKPFRQGPDQFFALPLYGQTLKNGKLTTNAPGPFRASSAAKLSRFRILAALRPAGSRQRLRKQFYLWPLFYKSVTHLDDPVPDVKLGALPSTRATPAGYISETILFWPFFGLRASHRPYPLRRAPLLPGHCSWQGHGAARGVNRWAAIL